MKILGKNMTISHSRLFFAIACMLAATGAHAQQVERGRWDFFLAPSENTYKLMYVIGESNHAELFLRCELGSGNIVFSHEIPQVDIRNYSPRVLIGNSPIEADTRVEWDADVGQYFLEVEFSATSSDGIAMARSNSITIDRRTFPITGADAKLTVSEFVRVCSR